MRFDPKKMTKMRIKWSLKMTTVFPLYAFEGRKDDQNWVNLTKCWSSWKHPHRKIANKFWKGCFARFFSFTTSFVFFMRILPLWPRDCHKMRLNWAWEGSTHFTEGQERRDCDTNLLKRCPGSRWAYMTFLHQICCGRVNLCMIGVMIVVVVVKFMMIVVMIVVKLCTYMFWSW